MSVADPNTGQPGTTPAVSRGSVAATTRSGKSLETRKLLVIGALASVGLFGGFVTWAILAPLKSAVIADGYAKIPGYRKKVQHLEGGIVEAVLVREGERVAAGQVLLQLENKTALAQRELLRGQLVSNLALDARLLAEQLGTEGIIFPAELVNSGEPHAAQLMEAQRVIFTARRTALAGSFALKDQRIAQINQQIVGLTGQAGAYDRQIDLIREEVNDQEKLWSKQLTRKSQMSLLMRQSAQLEAERGKAVAEIARNRAAIAETEEDKLQVRRKMIEETSAERKTVQDTIFDLRQRIASVEDVIDRLRIRATSDGIIVGLNVNAARTVIAPRETILEIVPEVKTLTIEANVRPSDIDVVRRGLNAQVQIATTSARRAAKMNGRVVQVSADRLFDDRSRLPYFRVDIELDASELQKHHVASLYPGMPAEVFIETGSRSFARYVLSPLFDGIGRAVREQ